MDPFLSESEPTGSGPSGLDSDVELLKKAWKNEKAAPDILPYEHELVKRVQVLLEDLEEKVEVLKGEVQKAMELEIHTMDLDRVRYLLRAYLRARLLKIDNFAVFLTSNASLYDQLSPAEQEYCDKAVTNIQEHFDRSILLRLPKKYQSMLKQSESSQEPDMIDQPNLDTFLLCRATRQLEDVQLDPATQDFISMAPGEVHILRYRHVRELVEKGDLELL